MKMLNRDIIENYGNLIKLQEQEKNYFKNTGKKLLRGRIKISFAISKNVSEFKNALKIYNNVFEDIVAEYRDTEEEKRLYCEEAKKAKEEKRKPEDISIIIKNGKTKEEYMEKITELQSCETEINISKVNIDLLDGLDLDSCDINKIMFMISEE